MYTLILLFLTQTVAPSPLNFTEERVNIDGHRYVVRNQNNRITIEEERTWPIWLMDRINRERKNHIASMFNLNGNNKESEIDRGCLWGCLIVLFVSGAFWGTVIYLIYINMR